QSLKERIEVSPYPYVAACTQELSGLISTDHEEAAGLLLAAAEAFAAIENGLDRARCLRLAGEALLRAGRTSVEVISTLRNARELAETAGARAELNRVEAAMRALGARPRAGRPQGRKLEGGLSPREA